jgi:hypothetical protein
MPTQQELNISAGSLSLIKQRDAGSGVIFVNPTDSSVDIKMENTSFEIDNKSVNEHIDTAFSYYKFPARVIVEDISDVDLTAQLEAVTTDTALFYRYQASPMVLPNLDIATIGSKLEIINNPSTSFIYMRDFSWFGNPSRPIQLDKRWDEFQGFVDGGKTGRSGSNTDNAFFDRVQNENYASNNYNYHYGVRYYMRKDEEYRDSRLTEADKPGWERNPHTGGEIGFFMYGWSDNVSAKRFVDQFIIYEPYLKDSINLEDSFFMKMYNSLRYTPAGRRIVELDQIAKKQVISGSSNGRYTPSSVTSNEFNNVKFNEYPWNWYYVTRQRTSVIYIQGLDGSTINSSYNYIRQDGTKYIPEQTFKLHHTFDSILDENFKEISFNQLIDGSQQLANRFTITKDVLGYNADIAFNINIGLSHLNSKSTFIIRLIRYDGASSNRYDVIRQLDHSDVKDTQLLQTSTAAADYKSLLNKQRQLTADLSSQEKKLATEQSNITSYTATKTQLEKDRIAVLTTISDIQDKITTNEANIKTLQSQITTWKNSLAQKTIGFYNTAIANAEANLTKLLANRSTLSTQLRNAKDKFESIEESLATIPRDINHWTAAAQKTRNNIDNSIKPQLTTLNTQIKAFPSLGENADIILGENSYLLPGKSFFQFTYTIPKRDLKPYDSYAVEILTNSPISDNVKTNFYDYKSGKSMELITDNTSWEIMPVTEYTKQYTQRYKDEQATRFIDTDDIPAIDINNSDGDTGVELTQLADENTGA